MEIKWTIQGLLIYAGLAGYLATVAMFALRKNRAGFVAFAAGFVALAAAVVYRGFHVGHVPLRNLFEVFMFLAAAMFPLNLFCRRVLQLPGRLAEAAIGAVLLVPVGFVFDAQPKPLPPVLQCGLFVPHVAAYMAAYVILAKATVLAGGLLGKCRRQADEADILEASRGVYALTRMAMPLLTLGLVLGAVWGKLAWGDWWNWDPKELWSLATWLVYLIYFHVRATVRRPRVEAGMVLLGMACVIITLLWVNLSKIFAGMHNYAS